MTLEGTTEALAVQTLVANYNGSRAGLPKRRKPGARPLRGAMTVPSTPSTGRLPSCSLPAMPQGSGAPFFAVMPQPATSSLRSGTQRGELRLDDAGVAAVAKAIVAVRSYFMPKRVKAVHI